MYNTIIKIIKNTIFFNLYIAYPIIVIINIENLNLNNIIILFKYIYIRLVYIIAIKIQNKHYITFTIC